MPPLFPIRTYIIFALLSLCWTVSGPAFGEASNLQEFSQAHQSHLLTIASDDQALNFYKKHLYRSQHISRHHRNTSRTRPEPAITHHRITLVANLLASRLALRIQSALQEMSIEEIRQFFGQQQATYDWVKTKSIPRTVTKMLDFQKHAATYIFNEATRSRPARSSQFDKFAAYLDQHYPALTGPRDSWVGMLEHGNISGISQRLSEYWKLESSRDFEFETSPANLDHYEQYYVRTRLWPVFKSHLISLTILAETEAIQFAKQSMSQIIKKQDVNTLAKNEARLCGTWHWTVHNHQNHADHKMTVVFGEHAKSPPTKQPQPAEVKINGDTVYLLWKFPKGFQEDSLLLSQDDKRLEGMFQNTLGPHGSITGKRLSSCKP